MGQLRGARRARAREVLLAAMREDGRWLTTTQAHEAYYRWFGVDTSRGGWIWGVPEDEPIVGRYSQMDGLLRELLEAGAIERRRRPPGMKLWLWRALPLEPVPDTFPADWTREPVLA
jgi:hypothetical protein